MHRSWLAAPLLVLAGLLGGGCSRAEPAPPGATEVSEPAPKQAGQAEPRSTPLAQSSDPADVELTSAIRKRLADDERLSMAAKNILVITDRRQVSLRGSVASEAEREAVARHARAVEGVQSVDVQLEVDISDHESHGDEADQAKTERDERKGERQ